MWELTELEALQKLFDTKFDSNLEDLLYEDELEAIRRNGTTLDNLKNRIIVPIHKNKVIEIIYLSYLSLDENNCYSTSHA